MIVRGQYAKVKPEVRKDNGGPAQAVDLLPSPLMEPPMPAVVEAVVNKELDKPVLTPAQSSAKEETVDLRSLDSGMVARDATTMKALRLGPFSVTKDPDLGDRGICIFADADPEVGTEGQEKVQGAVIRLMSKSGDALLIVIAKEAATPKPEEAAAAQPIAAESAIAMDAQQTASEMGKAEAKEEGK